MPDAKRAVAMTPETISVAACVCADGANVAGTPVSFDQANDVIHVGFE